MPPDELNAFLSATHADPFRILGPHRCGDDLVIRVFRPDAKKIVIVRDANPNEQIEAEKIHRDGFFCARVPGASRDLDYHIEPPPGKSAMDLARSLPLWADHGRSGSASVRGRPALADLRQVRRAPARPSAVSRRLLRGLGAERAARQRGGRFQRVGRPGQPDAQIVRQRSLGTVFAGCGGRGALQVRDPDASAARSCSRAIPSRFSASTARRPLRWFTISSVQLERRGMDGIAAEQGMAEERDEHLRSASRIVAAGPTKETAI